MRRSRRLVVSAAGSAVLALAASATAQAATYPSGFSEQTVFSGLTNPTAIRFASDGRVFVAEKSGQIKVFDSLSDPTAGRVRRSEDAGAQLLGPRPARGLRWTRASPQDPYVYVALHPRRGDRRHGAALGHARGDLGRVSESARGDGRRLRRQRASVAPHARPGTRWSGRSRC